MYAAFAVGAFLLGACITYFAARYVNDNLEAQRLSENKATSVMIASSVQTHMRYRILALERMAKRLQRSLRNTNNLDLETWRLDAREYFASQPGYIALQVLDADASELATMPVLDRKISKELYAHFENQNTENTVPGFEHAAKAHTSGTIELADGRYVLALAFPLFDAEETKGYLVSFMDLETLLGFMLRSEFRDLPNFVIQADGRDVLENGTLDSSEVQAIELENLIRYGKTDWSVRASHSHATAALQQPQVRGVAVAGLTGSLLLAILAFLALQNFSQVKRQLHAEQRARDSERFLQLIMDHTPDLVFVKDANFKICQMNKAMLALYPDKTLGDIIGTTTIEDYDEKEAEEFLRFDRIAFLEGRSETEESILFPSGNREVLLTSKLRFYDENGSAFILGVARIITPLKRAQEDLRRSEERYKLAVDGTSVGIWDIDHQTGETFWSDRFRSMLGMGKSVRAGRQEFIQRLHPDDRDSALAAMADHITKRTAYDVEYRLRHENGNYVWIHSRGQASWDNLGNPIRVVGSIDDITDKKVATQELLRSNKELDDFAYIASHDLKEPLRGIYNHVRFLEEDYHEVLGADGQHRIDRLKYLSKRLEKLISDLLAYSRLGRAELRKSEVNLNALVEDIMQSFEQGTVKLKLVGELPTLVGSDIQLSELFRNLLTNAVKYNESAEKQITISCARGHHSTLGLTNLFSIADNGIGIPEHFREDVFKIFKRLHGQDEYEGGTGSGLTFAKKIVERYRGEIWLTDNELGGTTVCFSLPDAELARN